MLPAHADKPGGSLSKPVKYGYLNGPPTGIQDKKDAFKSIPEHNAIKTAGKQLSFTLNDGNTIPALALSTSLGHSRDGSRILPTDHPIAGKIKKALMAGYKHLDTAFIYRTEGEVARGIQNYLKTNGQAIRGDIFVTTKLWNDAHDRKNVIPALEKSLKRLQLDYVDLYLMHYPVAYSKSGAISLTDYLETWKGMEDAKERNLTRSIGVSNFNISQMQRLWDHARIKPAVLQIEVNPTITQEDLVNWCNEHDVVVMAYCPFGAILKKKEDAPPVRHNHPVFKQLCKVHQKTVAQILLRYLIERYIIPTPRITKNCHLKEYLDIFDFKLTTKEVSELSALNANYRMRVPIKWYPHPHFPFEKEKISELALKHVIDHSREDEY